MNYRFFWSGLALACLLPAAASAAPSYGEQLSKLEAQLSKVEQDFSVRNPSLRARSLDERLEDGIILQAAGDHQRASYVFMDIVSHTEWKGKPGYQAAQLQLGRSLYEDGYYRLSQRHLIDLLQNGVGSERTDGVLLLLQVAQKTGGWAEVNEALAGVSDFSRAPAYLYILGRAMFLQGDYDTARTSLERVNSNDEWEVKAEYLIGVLDILKSDFDSAMVHFAHVAADTRSFKGSDDVHTLAILAQARLYYERTEWSKAIDQYQRISENSPYFPVVLYEMGWTQVRLEDYMGALQKFELLLLSYPEDSHALETRRLLADLKRELGQYDEAVASYQKIVDEFSPMMSQMEREAANMGARKEHLKRRIETERYEEVQIVPARAKGLVAVGSDVNRVEGMLNSLTESDANTTEAESIAAEINTALQSDSSVRNLPEFQQYTQRIRDIRVNSLLIGYDFTAQYGNVSSELKALADEVARLPRTQQEREMLSSMKNSEREEREARFHHLKLQGESLKHRTRILKSWLESGRASTLSDEERAQVVEQIESLESQLRDLRGSQNVVESELRKFRAQVSTDSQSGEDVEGNLETMRSMLQMQWQKDSAAGDYAALISQENSLFARLDSFDSNVNGSIQARIGEFRSRLDYESQMLAAEKERYVTMKSDVGEAAGDVSARYWQSVYDQIRDMVLNADLGMVDIAWLQKDARSKALATAMDERRKEREVLEQDFRQFLKESGQE